MYLLENVMVEHAIFFNDCLMNNQTYHESDANQKCC